VKAAGERPFAGVCVVPWWANEGVSEDRFQFAVASASSASSWSIVALFSLIGDGVTARWKSAVCSASVGLPIGVQETAKIALFASFLNTVSTLWWWGITWSSDSSGSELLNWSASNQTVGRFGEGIELMVVDELWLIENQPLDVLGARRVGDGSLVVVGSSVLGHSEGEIDSGSDLSLSAVVWNAEKRASVNGGIRVASCEIAFLSVDRVDDTITAVWFVAVGTTGVGPGVGVVGSIIALFAGVDNTITTEGKFAVGSAGIGDVGITSTKIALFSSGSFEVSVTALKTASGVTTITRNGVVVITSFVAVEHTITALGENAVHSASVLSAVAVEVSVVTLFNNINDTVTANWVHAVGSASVGKICVVTTVVALFGSAVIQSATALLFTSGTAPPVTNVN